MHRMDQHCGRVFRMHGSRFFPRLALSALVASVLIFAGCSSARSTADRTDGDAPADTTQFYGKAIHVLIDGRDVGPIPRTVRVNRSFGVRDISLFQSGKVIRRYEIGISSTAQGEQTRMGFFGSRTVDGETYDVRMLPSKDEVYQIPFSNNPMRIEDHEYGLTMLVRE